MSKEKTFYVRENNSGRLIKTAYPEHWQGEVYTLLSNKEGHALYREQCEAKLREMLPKGSNVYTILRSVSPSGMSRQIQCVIVNGGSIQDITYLVSQATGYSQNKAGYLTVGGCGMDMGFAVVSDTCRALYGDDISLKQEWL